MKIALCSSSAPFINGGYRNIVEWLERVLQESGHQVERVYLPQVETPNLLMQQMMAYRWIDLDAADRIICFRPGAHLIPHQHKILWFIHHIRAFYDLWDTPYRGFPDDRIHRGIRDALRKADTNAMQEAKAVFANSRVVVNRLKLFNNVDSTVLYPPLLEPEQFFYRDQNDEILCICRIEHHKRQHLLIEAMKYTQSSVKLRICGTGSEDYFQELCNLVLAYGLEDRVWVESRWITQQEKITLLSNCLAVAYLPLDEDSYGYPSLEGSHSSKAILTTSDAGGVLELVSDGMNGLVAEPTPEALGQAMDQLHMDARRTAEMGKNAAARVKELKISWPHVVQELLA